MSVDYQPVPEWEQELNLLLSQSAEPKWSVFCPEETSSTMDFLRQVYEKKLVSLPSIVLAKKQSAGRGRQGRAWESTSEDITFSIGLAADGNDCSSFALVVAVAVNKVLEDYGCKVRIKWPNDILTSDNRKICGILVEKHGNFLNVGIGINVQGPNASNYSSISDFTESLPSATEVVWLLAPLIYMYYSIYRTQGFAAFKDDFDLMAIRPGSAISVNTKNGLVQGVYQGVDEHGALQVLIGDRLQVLTSAEISLSTGE